MTNPRNMTSFARYYAECRCEGSPAHPDVVFKAASEVASKHHTLTLTKNELVSYVYETLSGAPRTRPTKEGESDQLQGLFDYFKLEEYRQGQSEGHFLALFKTRLDEAFRKAAAKARRLTYKNKVHPAYETVRKTKSGKAWKTPSNPAPLRVAYCSRGKSRGPDGLLGQFVERESGRPIGEWREVLFKAKWRLPLPLRRIINRHYPDDGGDCVSLSQLAKEMGMTRRTIKKMHDEAIELMRPIVLAAA